MSHSVFLIDKQIFSVQQVIHSGNVQIQKKQVHLSRLKNVLSQLYHFENEFHYNNEICLEPALSKTTWKGSLAGEFDFFKERELQGSYQSIKQKDLFSIISRVEMEMEKIKQEIASLENSQASSRARLNDLNHQRRKEFMRS
ncbi:hypothetical protein BTS2_0408 [Bacillus sp. TS-2]|nr:hypothetical protein BTS2_0408 [Bacillus sp. TS-2]